MRAQDRELLDEPRALVRRGGVNFMAAKLNATDVNANEHASGAAADRNRRRGCDRDGPEASARGGGLRCA